MHISLKILNVWIYYSPITQSPSNILLRFGVIKDPQEKYWKWIEKLSLETLSDHCQGHIKGYEYIAKKNLKTFRYFCPWPRDSDQDIFERKMFCSIRICVKNRGFNLENWPWTWKTGQGQIKDHDWKSQTFSWTFFPENNFIKRYSTVPILLSCNLDLKVILKGIFES